MSFASDIAAFQKRYEERASKVVKKVALDMFKSVIMKTPVDTGRARSNWMVGINRIPQETGMGIVSQGGAISKMHADVDAAKLGDAVALANSVAYIGTLEYGGYPKTVKYGSEGKNGMRQIKSVGGFSHQAPNGMVRITVEEFVSTVNKAVSLVRR